MITLHTLASGSEGNSLLVSADDTHLLVDAGISARRIKQSLALLGLTPDDLSAILISHEHTDHTAGLATLLKHHPIPLYATGGTAFYLRPRLPQLDSCLHLVSPDSSFPVGSAQVTVFATSHDAGESVDYRVDCGDAAVGILTDTGFVPEPAAAALTGVDLLVLESNHDVEWLRSGPYPYSLKQRILGQRGHLSNEDAAAFARRMAECGTRCIILAHLSRENNTPQRALAVMETALSGLDVTVEVAPSRRAERLLRSGGDTVQKVTVLCVGKLKEKFYLEAAAEYAKRLQRLCRLEVIELPESRLPDEPSPAEIRRALQTEAAAIREKLPKGGALVALCIEGKPCSSEELSRRLTELGVQGKTQITFLIGGSVGLDESLKQQADWRLSMSPMTFPHHMARIMLLEQIYRAYQIAGGAKYHK